MVSPRCTSIVTPCVVASFSVAATATQTNMTTRMRRSSLRARVLDQIAQCQDRSRTASWSAFVAVHADAIDHNQLARQHVRRDLLLLPPSTSDSEDDRGYGAVRTLPSEADVLDRLRPTPWRRSADTQETEEQDNDNTNIVILFHNQFEPATCRRAQHKYRKLAQELQMRPHKQTNTGTSPGLKFRYYPRVRCDG